ncbi:MAG: MATE family efflux transporter [Oscillospiraceae bacterium]|nr:MATE family efflux transporter [Oscillospiraceae bacterium]
MTIKLSDHFTYGRLLRFTLPSIVMMVFTSIYGVVDGIFVSNFAGKTAFAAVNLVMPVLMMLGVPGFMLGTGGTALISKTLGEKDKDKASGLFTMLTLICILSGVVLTVLGMLFMRPIAKGLGAEGQMLEDCVLYGLLVLPASTAYILQFAFQSFCVAAEKPGLSLAMMVTSGICNIVLDALFVAVFGWGLVGAAVATAVAQFVGVFIPLIYFARPNESLLRFQKFSFDGKALLRTCANGSSELMSNLSMNLVSVLYNLQLMRYAGEDGIAAYGVIMYVNFMFLSVAIGFSVGTAPLIGFNYGADNRPEQKNIFKKSMVLLTVFSVLMTATAMLLARPLSTVFVGYDRGLLEMTVRGFYIYSLSFLLCGFNIFGSSMFTALNNGLISAVISFVRTLVCQTAAVLLLPLVWELDGVWFAIVAAESAALLLTAFCILKFRKRYHYL